MPTLIKVRSGAKPYEPAHPLNVGASFPKEPESPVKFWNWRHEENLIHTTLGDAMAAWADEQKDNDVAWADLPETVAMMGFAPMGLNMDAKRLAEDTIERLYEELCDPNDTWPEPTKKVIEATEAFLKVIADEIPVWACEGIEDKEVLVADYITKRTYIMR